MSINSRYCPPCPASMWCLTASERWMQGCHLCGRWAQVLIGRLACTKSEYYTPFRLSPYFINHIEQEYNLERSYWNSWKNDRTKGFGVKEIPINNCLLTVYSALHINSGVCDQCATRIDEAFTSESVLGVVIEHHGIIEDVGFNILPVEHIRTKRGAGR